MFITNINVTIFIKFQNLTQFVKRYLTILEKTRFYISISLVSELSDFKIDIIFVISSLNFSNFTLLVIYFYTFSKRKFDFKLMYISITITKIYHLNTNKIQR